MSGTSKVTDHQIIIKDDKPIKQRYYPKNAKVQGVINAKVANYYEWVSSSTRNALTAYPEPLIKNHYLSAAWT